MGYLISINMSNAKIRHRRLNFYWAILLLLAVIPLVDLFQPGLPMTHDGQDHVARIANFYQNLQEGVFIPRWAPNLNWGYGHPILMFLYPLPSYIASLFHVSGFSFVDSTKLVFALAYILSGLTMFLWLKEFLNPKAAYFGSLLYLFAPYRFIDIYVRGAIGEHMAFLFAPLVFYFLLKLSKHKSSSKVAGWNKAKAMTLSRWTMLGAFSLCGLILSHNAISLMFLPVIFLYALFLIWQTKRKKFFIFHFSLLIFYGFSLSAFFWLPAYMEGKYTLRDIVTRGGFKNNFGSISQLIYGSWNYGISGQFSLQVGIIHWISAMLAIPLSFYLYAKKNKLWVMTLGILFTFIISLFLIDKSSLLIWERISLIQKFQFPWRFLTVSVFSSAVLGAIVVSFLPRKHLSIIIIILTLGVLFLNKDYWHAKDYLNKPESFYTSIYQGTTDTGESAPIWSVRFMESSSIKHIEVIGGKATTRELERLTAVHSKAQIRENTLYFPGWQVLVDGKSIPIQFQDSNNRGVITFFVEKGAHDVEIKFGETKLRSFADIISIVSLFILISLAFLNKKIWQNSPSR